MYGHPWAYDSLTPCKNGVWGQDREGDGLCRTDQFSTQTRQDLLGLEVMVLTSTPRVNFLENPFNLGGTWGVTFNGCGFSFGGNEGLLKLTVVTDGCTIL